MYKFYCNISMASTHDTCPVQRTCSFFHRHEIDSNQQRGNLNNKKQTNSSSCSIFTLAFDGTIDCHSTTTSTRAVKIGNSTTEFNRIIWSDAGSLRQMAWQQFQIGRLPEVSVDGITHRINFGRLLAFGCTQLTCAPCWAPDVTVYYHKTKFRKYT